MKKITEQNTRSALVFHLSEAICIFPVLKALRNHFITYMKSKSTFKLFSVIIDLKKIALFYC